MLDKQGKKSEPTFTFLTHKINLAKVYVYHGFGYYSIHENKYSVQDSLHGLDSIK